MAATVEAVPPVAVGAAVEATAEGAEAAEKLAAEAAGQTEAEEVVAKQLDQQLQ